MAAGLTSHVYPKVQSSRLAVDNLPTQRWVECASCIESKNIEYTTEAEVWAEEHFRVNPRHDRFRIVRQVGWRFVPSADVTDPVAT
ncbi:hypothetical protein AB0F46_26685 [Streptomyces sp. NPDC026665]|uniref:DUF7848 domain-containing protein n=1 Tax=Streptomyces sp. NPDC026665 TaxID=3154798 RepID=UPI0033EA19DF